MKLAIHHRAGSFSDSWIEYCKKNNIEYKVVNAFTTNIIEHLKDCNALMWHHTHGNLKDVLTAKRILFALEHTGKKVYPDFKSNWFFDDKVAQKYLFEAIGAPLVPSYVFYDKSEALDWARNTTFPKVFKLKAGAGARNVRLIKERSLAIEIINKAFSKGISQHNVRNAIRDDLIRLKKTKNVINLFKAGARPFMKSEHNHFLNRERGYVYFQDFVPDNAYDTRVVVIGNKAIAERRFVRKNDFRASGSGEFTYDNINLKAVQIAFDVARALKLQSVAYDFVEDEGGSPLIVEMSYGFGVKGISGAPGYWDVDLNWYNEPVRPQEWILEDFLKELKSDY